MLHVKFPSKTTDTQYLRADRLFKQLLNKDVPSQIKRRGDCYWDVINDTGQLPGNVDRMEWFKDAVALALIDNRTKYASIRKCTITTK